MKKILVPTDFSPASRKAEEYAAALSIILGAERQLLHVYRELMPATTGPEPWSHTISELHRENETRIHDEIAYLKQYYSVEVAGDVRLGFKGDSISDAARELEAGLIVLGMKKRKPNKLLGSTAQKMIRKTEIPVLVVPENAVYRPIKRIVLAVDFNAMTDSKTFEPLLELVKKCDAALRVVHVEQKGAQVKASELPEKLQMEQALYKFTYEFDKVEFDDVALGIERYMLNRDADLLVMVAHHHNIFERIFSEVHTRDISFDIKLPLLVLKKG